MNRRGRERRRNYLSRGQRLERAFLRWAANSVGIGVFLAVLLLAFSLWGDQSAREVRPTDLLLWLPLAPAMVVFFCLFPHWNNVAEAGAIWGRARRSLRLRDQDAREQWERRYGHLRHLNAWDLWGLTHWWSAELEQDDPALVHERTDRRSRRDQS